MRCDHVYASEEYVQDPFRKVERLGDTSKNARITIVYNTSATFIFSPIRPQFASSVLLFICLLEMFELSS
jgi:hypothetical protein